MTLCLQSSLKTIFPSCRTSDTHASTAPRQGFMSPEDEPVGEQFSCRVVDDTLAWLSRAVREDEKGYLVGHACPGRSLPDVLGALARRKNSETWMDDAKELQCHLPAGLQIVGLYGPSAIEDTSLPKKMQLPSPGILAGIENSSLAFRDLQGSIVGVQATDGLSLLMADYVILRLPWSLPTHWDGKFSEECLHLYFEAVPDASKGGGRVLPVPLGHSFCSKAPALVDVFSHAAVGGATAADAMARRDGPDAKQRNARSTSSGKKCRKAKGAGKGGGKSQGLAGGVEAVEAPVTLDDMVRYTPIGPVLDVILLHSLSSDSPKQSYGARMAKNGCFRHPTAMMVDSGTEGKFCGMIKGDLLVYVARKALFASVKESIFAGMRRGWHTARRSLLAAKGQCPCAPCWEVRHFYALDPRHGLSNACSPLAFPLSMTTALSLVGADGICFPGQEDDRSDLLAARKAVHERLKLPLNRPAFRTTCALRLAPSALSVGDEGATGEHQGPRVLQDVHTGLSRSSVADGAQHLVDGSYLFYHYLVDHVDDRGWGCAYRSLQTLVSFFRLAHYTTVPVPSHREIQQVLVDIGDKADDFVGSHEWIGSMEVGYYLDQALGLEWRSVSAPSGLGLAERASELAAHFDSEGTPVMMGGGSLAFTLLGVDLNEATGEVAFLILDPHYTGPEDLEVVQHKEMVLAGRKARACEWRLPASFTQNCFFNLCLPQRPKLY